MTTLLQQHQEEQDAQLIQNFRLQGAGEELQKAIIYYIHERESSLLSRITKNLLGYFEAADAFVGFTEEEWNGVKKFIPYLKNLLN